MAGIYIHIPFCKQACHYCDFHFSTNLSNKEALVKALTKEIQVQKNYLEREEINTIYFGGGSPSLLSLNELESILNSTFKHFNINPNAEITLEANPDDLTSEYLRSIHSLGVNRLSIGIQSFNKENLTFLNRVHTSEQSLKCLDQASICGFNNFSIDLIYGIPGDNHKTWERDLETAINFSPKHISAYCLTIEEKTVFGNWLKKGRLLPIDDEYAAQQYEILTSFLKLNKYEHYEISNFALPQFYSRHNSSYWQQKKYLGIGPSAHSYNGFSRRYNVENNNKYIKAVEIGVLPYNEEVLSVEDKINDYLLTSLRTMWGCNLKYIEKEFNVNLNETHSHILNKLKLEDLIIIKNEVVFLTKRGKLFADKITEELFLIE